MAHNGTINASVTVTNSGKRDGATVVQLYLNDPVASISRPVKELHGFQRIMLKAGESQTVSFKIDVNMLKFWNQQLQQVAEPGKINVMIGLDSARIQSASFDYR